MKTNIEETIRKLLRASQSGTTHERQVANVRAQELMRRYGLKISLRANDSVRIRVPNCAGLFWRQQVLLVATRLHRCKLYERERGHGKKEMEIAGYRWDAQAALTTYHRFYTTIVGGAFRSWRTCPDCKGSGYTEQKMDAVRAMALFGEILNNGWRPPVERGECRCVKVHKAWMRFYTSAAAEALHAHFFGRAKSKGGKQKAPPLSTDLDASQAQAAAAVLEQKLLLEMISELNAGVAFFDVDPAEMVRKAASAAAKLVKSIALITDASRLLMDTSTILPTKLELPDLVEPASYTRSKLPTRELDL